VKVPYVEDKPTQGGFGLPSEEDVSRMIRDTVESWQPQRGPDWPGVLMRLASTGPPAWLLYAAASAALVLILVTAFLVGSALHIGALAPQEIPSHLP
jgi:hypothetical protein